MDLDYDVLREVGDEPGVLHVAVELEEGSVAHDGVEDVGGVFLSAVQVDLVLL